MRLSKTIVSIVTGLLLLGAIDLYLIVSLHHCHLWLTREKDSAKREELKSQSKTLTRIFVIVNLGAAVTLVGWAIVSTNKKRRAPLT